MRVTPGHLTSALRQASHWEGPEVGAPLLLLFLKDMPCLRGKVVSGRAAFGLWIERLSSFYEQKTGMRLYPGTLNVELPFLYSLPRDVMRLEANEYGGRVSVSIVPCRIFNRKAFLLRTDQNEQGTGHHPRNVVEIATDIRLRDAYQLKDGDVVEIEFL